MYDYNSSTIVMLNQIAQDQVSINIEQIETIGSIINIILKII